ncbi:MAG: phosphotransferase family protein [Actinobacteria bacterium]|nr:phosphotransferase family protein [Actinomycetota bacterium]
MSQFRSGASNLTYLLHYENRDLVLRRAPMGTKAASAHNMKREALIQQRLRPVLPYVPNVVATCDDSEIIGADFYVMDKIEGLILRRNAPVELASRTDDLKLIGTAAIDGLVQLHQLDASILAELNKGPGYVARQVAGWSGRYRSALTEDVPDGEQLIDWLNVHQPNDVATCVIHGDWRLDNMVFNLEPAPKFWIDKNDEPRFASMRRQPTHLEGMPTRAEFIRRYLDASPWQCADFSFYEIFGLFRLAVIAQQIWARFRNGETSNPDFADFGDGVRTLMERAEKISSHAQA